METSNTYWYWIVAAVIILLLIAGFAIWYSGDATMTPGTPNTGTEPTDTTSSLNSGSDVGVVSPATNTASDTSY